MKYTYYQGKWHLLFSWQQAYSLGAKNQSVICFYFFLMFELNFSFVANWLLSAWVGFVTHLCVFDVCLPTTRDEWVNSLKGVFAFTVHFHSHLPNLLVFSILHTHEWIKLIWSSHPTHMHVSKWAYFWFQCSVLIQFVHCP